MCPIVSIQLSVLPIAVLQWELMESLQKLIMQHQGSGLQLINSHSQLRTGVEEFAGLHGMQKHKKHIFIGIYKNMSAWAYIISPFSVKKVICRVPSILCQVVWTSTTNTSRAFQYRTL